MKPQKIISLTNAPFVSIDSELDKFRDKVIFTKKLEKANKVLSAAKLPAKK
jgi:hypothetical protein